MRRLPPDRMYPAGESGVSQRFITIASGIRLRVVEAGSVNAPPVVLVHGWACTPWIFHANIPALAEAGFRVIAVELPGHGLSDKPEDPGQYTAESLRDAVIAALDTLGLPVAAIAGHSMGASIAVRVADRIPDRVSAVAMLSPVGFAGVPGMSLIRALTPRSTEPFLRLLATRFVIWAMVAVACRARRPTTRDVDEFHAPTQFPDLIPALRDNLHRYDWRMSFPRLAVPHLVVVGAKDHLSSARNASEWSGSIDPVIVEGAGHMLLDEKPDLVNRTLIEFFKMPVRGGYISTQNE